MNQKDRIIYYTPAAWNLFDDTASQYNASSHYALDEALGYPYYDEYCKRRHEDDFPLDDDMRELLIKLAGPHGKTILKMYRIKKGLDKCETQHGITTSQSKDYNNGT